MADRYTALPRGNPMRQRSASGNASVYRQPEGTDTSQSTAKDRIDVDRPERTPGSWSPMIIITLILGVLILLWVLGMFDYLLA